MPYQPGDEIAVTIEIVDNLGAVYDPAVVKYHYTDPLGVYYTKTYGTDAVVTKTSAGHYKLVIYIPYVASAAGNWYYDAQAIDGNGNSVLVENGQFLVQTIRTL